jgi:hypothetical protein
VFLSQDQAFSRLANDDGSAPVEEPDQWHARGLI